jgi:hypothetical protein
MTITAVGGILILGTIFLLEFLGLILLKVIYLLRSGIDAGMF